MNLARPGEVRAGTALVRESCLCLAPASLEQDEDSVFILVVDEDVLQHFGPLAVVLSDARVPEVDPDRVHFGLRGVNLGSA